MVSVSRQSDNQGLTIRTITPSEATKMLDGEQKNRPIRDGHVAKLARAMKDGRWLMNGSTIVVTKSGRIHDGQHRLWACIEAGVPFQSIVVDNVADSDEVFESLGEQLGRTASDLFCYRGVRNATLSQAACTLLWFYDQGKLEAWHNTARLAPSKHELWDTYIKHNAKGMMETAVSYAAGPIRQVLTPSMACFGHVAFGYKDSRVRDEFLNKIKDGLGLTNTMAVYWLRKRMAANFQDRSRLPVRDKLALLIKAWNFTLQGRSVSVLKWNPDEPFPEIM